MRKLISKDPVLRYKLGKKIIKALNGNNSITFRNKDFYYNTPDGREYKMNSDWFRPTTPDSSDLSTNYNRKYVRSQRNNYSNVDDYYNYIISNQNSNEGKLWNRILGTLETPQAKRQAFDEIMNTYGIKGNLGRRDSKRLSNVMNTIKGIATDENELNNYLDSYLNQYTRGIINNSLTPYFDFSKILWRSTPTNNENNIYNLDNFNLFKRFKVGGNIEKAQDGTKFYVTQRGKKEIGFKTREESDAYRKKNHIVGQIYERGQEQRESRVLRADETKSGHTKYGRLQEESLYNGLTFKQAYNKARKLGKEAFGYKGKVYSTDLGDKATVLNMTRMKTLYGNYLGYQKDPKLLNKQSRAGREAQNRRLDVDDSYKLISERKWQENQLREALLNSAAKISQNFTADKLVDALSPWGVVLNTAGLGISALNGEDYNGHLYRTVFNPMGIALDAMDNNYLGLGERALDAFGWFGGRPLGKVMNWAGTRFAPRIASISSKSAYLGKGATEPIVTESGEIIGRLPWRGATNAISGEVIPKGGVATGRNVTSYGTRSVLRAANEGVLEPLTVNGVNDAARYGNAAWRNNNTGLTYVFRNTDGAGNLVRNSYDVAVDNAVKGMPYFVGTAVPAVRATAAVLTDDNQ